jgi:hypothetical protein
MPLSAVPQEPLGVPGTEGGAGLAEVEGAGAVSRGAQGREGLIEGGGGEARAVEGLSMGVVEEMIEVVVEK